MNKRQKDDGQWTSGLHQQDSFDWGRFGVRFGFGAIPGLLLGFGFWIQMCRPAHTLGLREWFPRQLTQWVGLESCIDSAAAGWIVTSIFVVLLGLIVGLWPSKGS